jgi:branched-chain amino acid aminotransferase
MDRFDANVRQLNFPLQERGWYREQLVRTLIANKMDSGVHVRFVVTRGDSITPFQSPRVAFGGPHVIIIPEFKPAQIREHGLRLILSPYRRSRSDMFSPEMHVTSKIPDILNMIYAEQYGADEPLMLDDQGNVKAGSSTCFFLVIGDKVVVPTSENMLQGVTRQKIIDLVRSSGNLKIDERIVSVHDLYKAQEAFVSGTAGGVVPVQSVDNMKFLDGSVGPVVSFLQASYQELVTRVSQRPDYEL